jgi:hypothetical protein
MERPTPERPYTVIHEKVHLTEYAHPRESLPGLPIFQFYDGIAYCKRSTIRRHWWCTSSKAIGAVTQSEPVVGSGFPSRCLLYLSALEIRD